MLCGELLCSVSRLFARSSMRQPPRMSGAPRFSLHRALLLVGLTCCTLIASHVSAQAPLDAQQLEALQQLSPEDQAALLDSLGQGSRPPATLPLGPEDQSEMPRFSMGVTDEEQSPEEPRIEGRGTIVIEARLPEGDLPEEFVESINSDTYRSRLLGIRAYELTTLGVLELAGIGNVPLGGLTADEAATRLAAEPLLEDLQISVTILPLTPIGEDALRPFGYELFDERPDLFGARPPQSTPVPGGYVLGPGDSLRVQLFGDDNYEVELEVSPEGVINFPKLGPQAVSGLTFSEVKSVIEKRTAEQIIGTQAAVSMGRLKNIRIFVVGDVKRPGAYDVSGLSKITNALYASGGISSVGSLRRVQLKRAGRTVSTLDLYALLLSGDTRQDAPLRSDDVVFIPPVGPTVAVDGEVNRPAIYELGSSRSLAEVVALAGGLKATADRRRLRLERITETGLRSIDTVDLKANGGQTQLRDGDSLKVLRVLDDVDSAVTLTGHVTRAGGYEWSPGMRISDLLPSEQFLKPKADLAYVVVRREVGPDRRTQVISADLQAAQASPGSLADVPLSPRDRVTVFELGVARSAAIDSLLEELSAQASVSEPVQIARITGAMVAPGDYPLEPGMRVSDLLRAGGGLAPSAHVAAAELTRYRTGLNGTRETELISVDLGALLSGDAGADRVLAPYDILTIKQIPDWEEPLQVELTGEVRFPGSYPVRRGETLSALLDRAGGLTELAFTEGTVFTRKFLREREIEQLALLRSRLESDLSALAVQQAQTPNSSASEAFGIGQSLLEQIEQTEAQGRLVIDLRQVLANPNNLDYDIVLRDGDELVVPLQSQEVTVIGEVQYATSHRHQSRLSRNAYIDLSGGLTLRADKKRIYVVRANGAVIAGKGSRWFRNEQRIQPGDTVVVPLDADRLPQITQWASITQVLYNLAIAAAAVNSF